MSWKMLARECYIAPSRIGERLGWHWLAYNPGVFLEFDLVAKRNAPLFIPAVLAVFPKAQTFCDVGCGTGRFVKELTRHGRQASGFEYSGAARRWARARGVNALPFDVSQSVDPGMGPWDLALSLEVAEHVPPSLAAAFVTFLTSCSGTIVFTAASPGQSGVGHVNCQPGEYWKSLFHDHGYECDADKTGEMQATLADSARLSPFLRTNLLCFHRRSPGKLAAPIHSTAAAEQHEPGMPFHR